MNTLDLTGLRAFLRERVLPGARLRESRDEFPQLVVEELHRLGFLHAFVPEDLGGLGLPASELLRITREVAYASRGLGSVLIAHGLAAYPILRGGTPELKRRVAESLLARPELCAFCFTEPEAGSDVIAIRTRAKKVPGGYELSGQKCFITNAGVASHYVVMAKLDGLDPGGDGRRAITAFYVPAGARGLSAGKPLEKLGHRESNTSEVYLDGVFVPDECLLGEPGQGLLLAGRSLARSRTLLSGAAVGLCDRARDLAVTFLTEREHYGKPLIEQPQIRGTLAQLETEARAAWALGIDAARAWDAGDPSLQHSSMAKMFAGQVAMRFASTGVELFGGWGFTREFEIETLFRDAKLFEIVEGPTFVQQVIIAKEILPPIKKPGAHPVPLKKAA